MEKQNIKLETYGKQNIAQHTYTNIKDRFSINPYSEKILYSIGLKPYVPKLNKLRVGVGLSLMLVCLATPFTNGLIPFIIGWLLK